MLELVEEEDVRDVLQQITCDPDTRWRYAAIGADGTATLAESATEMVADFIDGYAGLDDKQALEKRWDVLVMLANAAQRHYVSLAVQNGDLVLDTAGEHILTALFSDRSRPYLSDKWDGLTPLVLIATDYSPYTDRPAPKGKIVWVNPETEVSFLRALDTLDVVGVVFF